MTYSIPVADMVNVGKNTVNTAMAEAELDRLAETASRFERTGDSMGNNRIFAAPGLKR